jgi:hypothetical protein
MSESRVTDEKPPHATEPLHVQVARALGCKPEHVHHRGAARAFWRCTCPKKLHDQEGVDGAPGEGGELIYYDADWSATGPLIEKYGICLGLSVKLMDPPVRGSMWCAGLWNSPVREVGCGETPLIAVCRLLLELKQAGKLAA